ncbi:GSCOCG00008032001-RA-CDS [Cotesia congregata]|nr:GSCOCG00008032001-RA-CDS [Cotesia congregata]
MNESYQGNCFNYFKNVGILWYIVNPYESAFESVKEVPDYQYQSWFPFFLLIILEQLILLWKKKSSFRLNDHITSLSHWMLQESGRCRILSLHLHKQQLPVDKSTLEFIMVMVHHSYRRRFLLLLGPSC